METFAASYITRAPIPWEGGEVMGIDDWLEAAYEDRNGGELDTADDERDGDEDEMFVEFHDDE